MAALPPNWEWDYDGTRWFYRYKPNGHVQFHFPKDGDEFPDFFDAFSPIPDLAPEEKLESQQQLKRRTGVDTDPKSKMHATGGPLSDFAVNRSGFGGPMNDEDDGFFYQPENFMYLGPDAYTDIGHFAEEEKQDEIARSKGKSKGDSGQNEGKQKTMLEATGSDKTGVSPFQSETTLPSAVNSVPVWEQAAAPQTVAEDAVLIFDTPELPAPSQPMIPSPGVPLLDSVEKSRREQVGPPVQPGSRDPVGLVAEMATEHTAVAHIERHPDPVEIGDNAVLAPIETRMADFGIAELPERTSPSDAKPPAQSTHDLLHQTSMTDHALYGATFGSGPRPQASSPTISVLPTPEARPVTTPARFPSDHSLPEVVPQSENSPQASTSSPFSIKRKQSKTGTKQGTYQPYVPGPVSTAASEKQNRISDFKTREHRNSLAREASLMLGTRQSYETSDVPSILQPPKVPPKHPTNSTQVSIQHPVNPARPDTTRTQVESASVIVVGARTSGSHVPAPLKHVPSVLKPARGYPRGKPQESLSTNSPPPVQAPVLPRSLNQAASIAASFMAFQEPFPSNHAHQSPDRDTPYSDHIPHSHIPAPGQYQSPDPRPGVQRLETAPASSPLDSHPPRPRVTLQEGDPIHSQQTALPAFLQRPRGQSNLDQNHVGRPYAQATPTTIRERSGSDAPQYCHGSPGQSPFPVPSQPPPRSSTDFEPIAEPTHMSNIAARPQLAMEVMRGYSQPKVVKNMQHPDPILLSKCPRQTSYADSEVSSLGPSSEGQSSGQPLQTPSPLEAGGRRPSSGFFHGVGTNGYPEGSGASIAAQRPTTFSDHNARISSPSSRPGSFSGPSPTSTQSTTPGSAVFDVKQYPPVIPRKVPIHAPVDTTQAIAGAPASPKTRRHSLSTDQTIAGQPILGSSQTYKNGVSNLNLQSQGGPPEHGPGIPRPHTAQPLPSRLILSSAPGSQPPYPGQDPMRQSTERPQRPTVTPPTQQFISPSSPRTPGHILHPIQEHGDNKYPARPPVTNVHQGAQDSQRHSPAKNQQLSAGSSHYPSSGESPNAQRISKSTSQEFRLAHQPRTIAPQVPTAGQMYSPVQKNPSQQSPINPASYATQPGARPGPTPTVLSSPKDKEKGGWLSKFMKGSGKPNVLQKPQPTQQAFSTAPSSPNVMSPAQSGHWPHSLPPKAANLGLAPQQQAVHFFPTPEPPVVLQQIRAPVLEPAAPRPQDMAYQDLQRPVADCQEFQSNSQEPAMALGLQETPKSQGQRQAFPMQRPEQNPVTTSPPKFSPVLAPSTEQFVDNMSDAASVSAISVSTMDVSEAQAQPVLKPRLVTVEKSKSPSGQDQLPSRIAMTRNIDSRPSSAKADQHKSDPSPAKDGELTVAPLFSKAPTKAITIPISTDKAPIANDKWAKKPAVDYSGDDWGDDPWDYQ